MAKLLIDGKEAVIKKGTNFQLTFENTYYAKGNTWSFDIELPLDEPHNAAIFGAIGRHDVKQRETLLTAELIISGLNRITGTVAVTKVTETSVYVQLNTLSDFATTTESGLKRSFADRYIDQLDDLGKLWNVRHTDYPVCNTDGEVVGDWEVRCKDVYGERTFGLCTSGYFHYEFLNTNTRLTAAYQPYFYDTVVSIINAAGYTITTNALDTPLMRSLIIVRATTQKAVCSHLPHWTFSEFITEVEQFAGVHFLFNNNNTVDIVKVNSVLTGTATSDNATTTTYNTDVMVVDEFTAEAETTEEAELDAALQANNSTGNDNVGYDLMDDYSDAYEKLSDSIIDAANITTVSSWDEMKALHNAGKDNQRNLFLLNGNYYMPQRNGNPFKVNRFRDIKTTADADVTLLRIVPVAFTSHNYYIRDFSHGDGSALERSNGNIIGETDSVRIMVSEGRNPSSYIDDYLVDEITGNSDDDSDEGETADIMRVAFVDDLLQPTHMRCSTYYPGEEPDPLDEKGSYYYRWDANLYSKIPYTLPGLMRYDVDNIYDAGYLDIANRGQASKEAAQINAINARPYTLELTAHSAGGSGSAETIVRLLPNTQIEYTKQIIANAVPDVNKLFLIHGKRFICKSLTVEVNEDGIVPLMEGTFYMLD